MCCLFSTLLLCYIKQSHLRALLKVILYNCRHYIKDYLEKWENSSILWVYFNKQKDLITVLPGLWEGRFVIFISQGYATELSQGSWPEGRQLKLPHYLSKIKATGTGTTEIINTWEYTGQSTWQHSPTSAHATTNSRYRWSPACRETQGPAEIVPLQFHHRVATSAPVSHSYVQRVGRTYNPASKTIRTL